MRSIDYKDWAEYIYAISNRMDTGNNLVLELAGGDCNLDAYLNNRFDKIIVTDLSFDMLRLCNKSNYMQVCCDMTKLPFKINFPVIFSAFDSVNYLINENLLNSLFQNINAVLENNGIFTFDVSLERNSLKNERRLNRKGKFKDFQYFQKSKYENSSKIHYNYFKIINDSGKIFEELHKQKIYDFTTYFDIIERNNLYVCECFDAFTFEDVNSKSERAQFIVKKRLL